jgi:magnesium chelatase subunit D
MDDSLPGLSERSSRLLECAALTPGLRSVLVYGADPRFVEFVGSWLKQLLRVTMRRDLDSVYLHYADDDEDLWGRHIPGLWEDRLRIQWQRGTLVASVGVDRLVLIPELPRLGLSAMRAAVSLIGADVAHLEREGLSVAWKPALCWVAGCAVEDLGKVSPHLLDRFALRLELSSQSEATKMEWLRLAVNTREEVRSTTLRRLPLRRARHLLRAATHFPDTRGSWVTGITEYLPEGGEGAGMRRAITLARVAVAEARLDLANRVTATHLERAAVLLGIAGSGHGQADLSTPLANLAHPKDQEPGKASPGHYDPELSDFAPSAERSHSELWARSSETAAEGVLYPPAGFVFREDKIAPERELDTLRPPLRAMAGIRVARGPVVGSGPARGLFELAISSTLLHAARYQPIRRRNQRAGPAEWLLLPEDLRAYRRAPVADRLLVMVLDHTSLKGLAWHDAVQPHLHWAYVGRATICVVSVGTDRDAYRAERLIVRNLLAPQLSSAFVERPGSSTPLAHGLELAQQTLRHALQHGRGTVRDARLIVLTDGRGNVPLAAAAQGQIVASVGSQGLDDALTVARSIGRTKDLRSFVLAPTLRHLTDLPGRFAAALGATLVSVANVREEGAQ